MSQPLNPLRLLRNRSAYHEPILHTAAIELTGRLSLVSARWCRRYNRFGTLFYAEGVELTARAEDRP